MEQRFHTTKDIAVYLGFSEGAIRKWIRHGNIPFRKINGGIRFDMEEINKWTYKKR